MAVAAGERARHGSPVRRTVTAQALNRQTLMVEETRGRDLSEYTMPHAFLGTLNTYGWLQMIASHEVRHTKQMKEIAAALPKSVANL